MQLYAVHWIERKETKKMSDENRDSQVERLDNDLRAWEQMG